MNPSINDSKAIKAGDDHWSGPGYDDNGNIANFGVCSVNGHIYSVESLSMTPYRKDGKVDVTLTLAPPIGFGGIKLHNKTFTDWVKKMLESLGNDSQYPKVVIATEKRGDPAGPAIVNWNSVTHHSQPYTAMSSTDTGPDGVLLSEEV